MIFNFNHKNINIGNTRGGGGGSICNGHPFITPSINAFGFYAICQTKDQSVAVIMVHETLFDISKFNKLHTF